MYDSDGEMFQANKQKIFELLSYIGNRKHNSNVKLTP